MARRKPSGIIDVVKDIVSPWLGTPPGQYSSVTQAQGLARNAAETLDQTVTGGMVKAGVQGDKALVKQAAVNAAALGAGYIAGKAVQTAAGAINKSGVVARAINKLTKQEVWLHASPKVNLPQINPVVSPAGRPRYNAKEPLTFGLRVDAQGSKPYLPEYVKEITRPYDGYGAVNTAGKPVSIYVTKVPKTGVVGTEATGKWGISVSPQKVVQEISIVGKSHALLADEVREAIRRSGGTLRGQYSRSELAAFRRAEKIAAKKAVLMPRRKIID